MMEIGFYNGTMGALHEISCPILDRAVYFGDGCYDASYVYNQKVFLVDEHLNRFYKNCEDLKIELQYTKDDLKAVFTKMIKDFDGDMGMLYWQISRGTAIRYHSFPPREEVKPNFMAYLIPRSIAPKNKLFKVITLEDTRYKHCNLKTLNLLPAVMAVQKAKDQGCNEVIFHRDGFVTEMAHSNVSFLKNGELIYHPFDWKILPGVSIKRLLYLADKMGVPIKEQEINLEEAISADEIIVTSSGALCQKVSECDGKPVGGKDQNLFRKLQDAVYDDFAKYTGKEYVSC